MIRIKLKKYIIIFLVVMMLILLFTYHQELLKVVYPMHYEETIFAEAEQNDLDPYLVAAIIYVESGFDAGATSRKGAKGLMQIMPRTGLWIAESLDYKDFNTEALYQPKLNIKFGTWYLAQMGEVFNQQLPLMIAAYNGGQGNIRKWIMEGRWDGAEGTINDIPFPETRGYVEKVMRTYRRYRYIYK